MDVCVPHVCSELPLQLEVWTVCCRVDAGNRRRPSAQTAGVLECRATTQPEWFVFGIQHMLSNSADCVVHLKLV